MNSKQTIAYLDELQKLGFTDESFSLIHHFQLKNEKHPISTHRAYCENTDAFQADGNNERVQIRLEMILRYYKTYFAGNPAVFPRLAKAAYCMVPPLPL
jgi:hypothetical protein